MNESRFILRPAPSRSDVPPRQEQQRNAFTLVEVVIALAIFVFGALAIIRIFPPALGVIQNSGDRLVATNLNRNLLAPYESDPSSIPDAITEAAGDGGLGTWNTLAGEAPNLPTKPGFVGSIAGNRSRNNSLPYVNIADFGRSALGHYRRIIGEKFTAPLTPTAATQLVYTRFPIRTITGTPDTMDLAAYQEDTVTGVALTTAGTLDFTNAKLKSSGAAYTAPVVGPIAGPVDDDVLYASYSWLEGGRFWSVDEERVTIPTTGPSTVLQAARTTVGGANAVVPETISLRLRRPIALPALGAAGSPRPEVGEIPLAVAPGRTVSFDYTVRDWRWMVFDSVPNVTPEVPSQASPPSPGVIREVNLPVKFLDTDTTPNFYVLYPMNNTGSTISNSTSVSPDVTDKLYEDPQISKNARIPVVVNSNNTQAPKARIAYRTSENWVQQISVAAKHYVPFYGTPTTGETWREYALSTNGQYIYFHPSEAGKTVVVSYSTGIAANPAASDTVIEGQSLTIETDILSPPPTDVPANFATAENSVVRLSLVDKNGDTTANPALAIRQVDGASVHGRTAWLNGDRYTQIQSTRLRRGVGK